jgi:hypothetical protein
MPNDGDTFLRRHPYDAWPRILMFDLQVVAYAIDDKVMLDNASDKRRSTVRCAKIDTGTSADD